MPVIPRLLLSCLLLFMQTICFADTLTVMADPDTDINVRTYPATGDKLFIWQPSEVGFQSVEYSIAASLQQQGIEVWMADTLEARFLPTTESSLTRIPASDITALIHTALQRTHKHIYFLTQGRGAIPVLRGVALWQKAHPDTSRFVGSLLLSPKFFVETPEPGVAAHLMPIVSKTNQAIYLIQPDQSPWWWKLSTTLPALRQSGSDVFVHKLTGVRDRFYFRPDATEAEQQLATRLPGLLAQGADLLNAYHHPRQPASINSDKVLETPTSKKDRYLQIYKGNPVPPVLALQDMANRTYRLEQYRGKVVVLNFWASWCPPCVYEMPSLQRLYEALPRQQFEILAVNMAEKPEVIQRFLKQKVEVDFPVLLDGDGAALRRWQVFAFPTTYIIGPDGKIHYALFGATHWDSAQIIQQIRTLLPE